MLLGLSPLLLGIAIAIKLTSKGPVIYIQERLGKNKKPFNIYKFRTMKENAEKEGPQLAVPDDPRITNIGKFLRKYHLDELMQFWNVFKGQMSVVGPRPEREIYAQEISRILPEYERLFTIKPGITSLGMINYGYASNVQQMVDRALYDIQYLEEKDWKMESLIICKTIGTILKGKGL